MRSGTDRVDVAAHGLVARARLADRLGRRAEALRLYRFALTHVDAHDEFAAFFAELREQAAAGHAPALKDLEAPPLDFWLQIPR